MDDLEFPKRTFPLAARSLQGPSSLPRGDPVALDGGRHLYRDACAIVEVLEHVMALRFLESPPGTLLQGPRMRSAVWVQEGRTLSQP